MNKKIVLIVSLILMSAFLLVGCSSKTASNSTATDPSDIKAIKDRGVLNVGVKADVPKFGLQDPKTGQIDGMEIDLARAIAKKILGDETKIKLTLRITALLLGGHLRDRPEEAPIVARLDNGADPTDLDSPSQAAYQPLRLKIFPDLSQ